MVIKLSGK